MRGPDSSYREVSKSDLVNWDLFSPFNLQIPDPTSHIPDPLLAVHPSISAIHNSIAPYRLNKSFHREPGRSSNGPVRSYPENGNSSPVNI